MSSRKSQLRPRKLLAFSARALLYAALLAVFVGPLWSLVTTALSGIELKPGEMVLLPQYFTLDNFVRAWREHGVGRYFFNSSIVAVSGVLLQTGVSTFAAYALARKKFRGSAAVLLLFLSTMMLPEEVIAIPLYLVLSDLPLLGINLLNSYAGMVLPLAAWAFSIFVLTEFMRDIPVELEESARIDGANDLAIFALIILPLIKPALATVAVFSFIMVWDQYLLPLIVASETSMFTLPIVLRILRTIPDITVPIFMAASLLTMIPTVVVYLALQRFFERGLTAGAIKG
jgi:multiple sugar transport system permease protein